MLYVHCSNRPQSLADRLGDAIAESVGPPLAPETIVVLQTALDGRSSRARSAKVTRAHTIPCSHRRKP